MGQQITQFLIRELILDIEVYGYQHTFQSGIVLFYSFCCLIEFSTDIMLEVLEMIPTSILRDKEGIILILVLSEFICLSKALTFVYIGFDDLFLFFLKGIRSPFQKEQTKDIVLVFRSIHVPYEDVCCLLRCK